MSYVLSHTVFLNFDLWILPALAFLLLVVVVGHIRLVRLKNKKKDLEYELSSSSAEVALEPAPGALSPDEVNDARRKAKRKREKNR